LVRRADGDADKLARELEATNRSLKAEIKVRAAIESRLRRNRERLRSLATQLEDVEERERRRIAENLHDLIGQTLAIANMKLGLLARTTTGEAQHGEIEEVRRLNQRMLDETRNIITELSPPVLEEQDMQTAVEWLIDHFREKHDLDIDYEERLDDTEISYPIRRFVFRTLRELLFNVIKHARTRKVDVDVESGPTSVNLRVRDKGLGFDTTRLEDTDGFGLFSLQERVEAMGGSLELDSVEGSGTNVRVMVPRPVG
jgi:signal transduction histidine kinase